MIFDNVTYESALTNIAYSNVTRGEYPEPTPGVDDQIQAKTKELNDLLYERVPRPTTKTEYLTLIASLRADIASLTAQNTQIAADNVAARKAVDDAFVTAIAEAKEDTDYQWSAVRAYRTKLLADCDWTQVADSNCAEDWVAYRQSLRDAPNNNETPAAALAAINNLTMPTN